MPKKIFDIIPPDHKKSVFKETPVAIRKVVKNPDLIKEISNQIERKETALKQSEKSENQGIPKKVFKGFLFACLLALTVGLGVIVFGLFTSIKAEIKIWPKMESLNLTKDITASLNQKEIDYEKGILPGQTVNGTISLSEEFQTTGKKDKEEKAKGIIRVYNSFSDASQSLVLGTRFISSDGKIFKTTAKQVIPGGIYKGGKLVPGEIDINVEAAETGESYNIGPTTFSIPGFAGTSKYTAFYGKSLSAMSGGAKKEVSIVVQDDLDKAEASLIDKAKKGGIDSFKSSLSGDLVLVDGATVQDIKGKEFSLKVGDEGDKFTLKLSVDTSGLVFNKSDIQSFADDLIGKNIEGSDRIKDGSIQIGYAFKPSSTLSNLDFSVSISAKYYSSVDLGEIKKSLMGKSFDEVKAYLSDSPLKISKVEIAPGIFWRKSVPKNEGKVDVLLELE